MSFQVIGDELEFDGYRAATFRDDLPPSVRASLDSLIQCYPNPSDVKTVPELEDDIEELERDILSTEEERDEAQEEAGKLRAENAKLKALLEQHKIAVPA